MHLHLVMKIDEEGDGSVVFSGDRAWSQAGHSKVQGRVRPVSQ